MIRFRILVSLSLLFFLTPALSAQTDIHWKFKAGTKLNQEMVQKMTTEMTVGGMNVTSVMNQIVDSVWSIESVDANGAAQIKQTIERIRMKMTAPGGLSLDIDTASDEAPQGLGAAFAGPIKAMANAEFTMKMSPKGKILEANVSDETIAAMKAIPGAEQMGGIFTKEGMANMVRQSAPSLPEGPIAVGQMWTDIIEIPLPRIGTMKTQNQMTFAGMEDIDNRSFARINLDMKTSVVPPADNAGLQMKIKDQAATGKMLFDTEAGRLSQTDLTQNMVMELTVGGQLINQKIKQEIAVKVTER